jgi:hypothetical protein
LRTIKPWSIVPALASAKKIGAYRQVRAPLIEFPPDDQKGKPVIAEASEDLSLTSQDSSDDRFPLSEADLQRISAISTLFRSQLSTMTPAQLRSIAALLLALKRLPLTTPGIDISLSFSQPNTDGNYGWAKIHISEYELRLGIGEHFYDPRVGGDTKSQTLFETCAGADTFLGDIESWLSYAEARSADGSLSVEEDNSDFEGIDWEDLGQGQI